MHTVHMDTIHQHERHAHFWEFLWTAFTAMGLALLFVLLHMNLAR